MSNITVVVGKILSGEGIKPEQSCVLEDNVAEINGCELHTVHSAASLQTTDDDLTFRFVKRILNLSTTSTTIRADTHIDTDIDPI